MGDGVSPVSRRRTGLGWAPKACKALHPILKRKPLGAPRPGDAMNFLPGPSSEWIALMIGVLIGINYALDGWSGSPKIAEVSHTQRFRNLKFAALAFGLTLIADLKSLGITKSDHLFQCYLEGFIGSSIPLIAAVAVVISIKFWGVRKKHPSLSPDFSPVMDYVFYGFNYYRTESRKTLETISEAERTDFATRFLPLYLQQISASIAAIDSYLQRPNDTDGRRVAKTILQSVRSVVLAHYSSQEQDSEAQVNANYMLAYPAADAPPEVMSRLRFHVDDLAKYSHFLALRQYAEDDETEEFTLPVPRKSAEAKSCLLPGAPSAFYNLHTAIVDDTSKIKDYPDLDAQLLKQTREYFKDKRGFKSFASLNITYRGERVGVVNIESSQTFVFGDTEDKRKRIESLLRPLCLLLGFVTGAPAGRQASAGPLPLAAHSPKQEGTC